MMVKISYDDGFIWLVECLLDGNNGGYFSMVKIED